MSNKKNRVNIPRPEFVNEKIKFSFEFYDEKRPEYCLSNWSKEQIKNALYRLKDVSTKSFNELRQQRRVYHFSETDWNQTTEKNGFSDEKAKRLYQCHFALLSVNNQLTRIFGGYYEGTFYIVWFDINHQIWPTHLKHT